MAVAIVTSKGLHVSKSSNVSRYEGEWMTTLNGELFGEEMDYTGKKPNYMVNIKHKTKATYNCFSCRQLDTIYFNNDRSFFLIQKQLVLIGHCLSRVLSTNMDNLALSKLLIMNAAEGESKTDSISDRKF